MRRMLAVLLLALLLPAPAAAKELSKLDVCGASGCRSTKDLALLRDILRSSDGSGSASVPGLEPFYKLVYHVRAGRGESFNGRKEFVFSTYFVPSTGVVRTTDERGAVLWSTASPVFADALAKLAQGVKPFATPRITRVTVGGKPVAKPASYERLITVTSENTDYVFADDWAHVKYRTARPSPWNGILLDFSAKEQAIQRNNRWIHLDSALATEARLGAPLTGGGGDRFPWQWIGIGAAAFLAAGAGLLVWRFRFWEPKTA